MWNRLRSMWTVPDLRKKIGYTLLMLLIFRVVAYVPVPGIDPKNLQAIISKNSNLQQFFGLLDVFSGGSFKNFSVLALGVYPYITASIVVQLLQGIIPRLGEMNREGEAGRNRLAQITRYIAVPLAMLQAFSQMAILVNLGAVSQTQFNLFNASTLVPTLATIATLTAGTMFLVWLGELITENGIGNGISLIIFANIVAGLPGVLGNALVSGSSSGSGIDNGALVTGLVTISLVLAMIYVMVTVYMAQRRIPVRYPTKRRVFTGFRATEESTYIPMQVNSAGMIPLIFASSILLLPVVIANFVAYSTNKQVAQFFSSVRLWLDSSNWYYWVIYGVLVFLFTYFYAVVMWQQQNNAENLQKQGAFIPGIRPGLKTEQYLEKILTRITFGGALFLGVVAVAPALLNRNTSSQVIQAASLLIVVGVVLDTMKQIEGEMVMRNYSGFLG